MHFIKCISVSTNLLECLEDWTLNLPARRVTDVIYFYFRKAFDTVCHNKLSQLKYYGTCCNLFSWIEAFLCGRNQSIHIVLVRLFQLLFLKPVVSLKEVCWVRHCFCYLLMMSQ